MLARRSLVLAVGLVGSDFVVKKARSIRTEAKLEALPNPASLTVEKVTKAEFSNSVKDVEGNLYRLTTTSVRCMLGQCWLDMARAYAFGVYLGAPAIELLCAEASRQQEEAPKDALARINPLPTVKFGKGPFYAAASFQGSREGYVFTRGEMGLGYYLDNPKYRSKSEMVSPPVLIRLIMNHDVDGEHLANGFEKSLKPRILANMKDSAEELEQLRRLRTLLNRLDRIPKGTQFDLFRCETGVMLFARNGEVMDSFDSTLLSWAMVDTFLGMAGHLKDAGKKDMLSTAEQIYRVKPLTEFTQ